jgi:hypothetical protein
MRAKLRAVSVKPSFFPQAEGSDAPVEKSMEELTFCGVAASSYPADGLDENNSFAKWSPSVDLKITVANPALFGAIAQGDEFYVDFTRAVVVTDEGQAEAPTDVSQTKQFRKDLDAVLQRLKRDSHHTAPHAGARASRERALAVTKIQEAIMWLGMDLKAINEELPGASPNPYPHSYDPASPVIEQTADGLKL